MAIDITSPAFLEFSQAVGTLHNSAVREWKKQGGGVVGYFHCFVPEELILAAGCLPFRIRGTGGTGTELSDAYFTQVICSFPRQCFNQVLKGEYDFLDGVIVGNGCDHSRHIYDNWRRYVKIPFIHLLHRPGMRGEAMVDYLKGELAKLTKSMEKHFGAAITDEHLWQAIRLCNETRRCQRKLYELRKTEPPPISGAETVTVMVAGTCIPKEQYNDRLKELLKALSGQNGARKERTARLMIISDIGDASFLSDLVEDQGGLVVFDETCFGARTMWELCDESGQDPLKSIAKYYAVDRNSCPRIIGDYPRRAKFIIDMAREFNVDGVIGSRLTCCEVLSGEHYMLKSDLKAAGIPFLGLDREYIPAFKGQLRTRVQAFLETIGR
jgi:benzoyl-CoA reductase subunit C